MKIIRNILVGGKLRWQRHVILFLGILSFAVYLFSKMVKERGPCPNDQRQLSDRLDGKITSTCLSSTGNDKRVVDVAEDVVDAVNAPKLVVDPTKVMPLKENVNARKTMRTLSPEELPLKYHPVMRVAHKLAYMVDPSRKQSKCPKTIATTTRYSYWFKKRFKPNLKLFLDEHDIHDNSNYNKLVNYVLPFGLNSVDKNVLVKIVNNKNFANPSVNRPTHRCIRCAVVGGGGILNGSNAGDQIDSHDYVFRLNRAQTANRFAKDVGKRTSFYEFYPESQNIWTVDDPNAAFLFTSFKEQDIYYAERMMRQATYSKIYMIHGSNITFLRPPRVNVGRVKITHPDFVRYIFTEFLDQKAYRPTTGAILVFTALHICDEVTIYGFGYDPRYTVYYYDKQFKALGNRSTFSHNVENERALWNKLHSEGVIKLFQRDT